MTKHHWRQQIKSLFKSHVDPDMYERLKQTKQETEEKMDKIMKIIKEDGSNHRTKVLEELMNDYQKDYESLYDVHLNLTQQLNTDLHGKDDDKSSSDSDSDSDKNHSSSSSSSKISYAKLEKENAELRSKVMDLELNLRTMERKTNESTNDDVITKLQTAIEGLKREIEMEKDELKTSEEKNMSLEVMLRLSNQKNRVAEQLLIDKETAYKIVRDKNLALTRSLEVYDGMIRGIAKQLDESLGKVEFGIRKKFDEDYGGFVKSVSSLLEEVESLKGRVKGLKMEKDDEKDEIIRVLGEEKREAIRQLCVWNEYCRTKTLT